ncbi:hypothetical protein NE865_03564 [Phthorimaea operculella]|nr:hypothetical protein NE865_03564 [Phthorimaea operculella]
MNRLLLTRTWLYSIRRKLSTPAPGATPPASEGAERMSPRYRPSEFQKFILVWTKKFKTKEEIPTFVSPDLIERSRSEARIKIANVMMLMTALASLGAVFLGKAAAKRGESVHQMNKDWHKQYQDTYAKENAQHDK